MALNWKTFWTRAFTALVFVGIMLVGLLYNEWSFFLLIAVIHFGCWWEYLKLIEKINETSFHTYTKLGFCLIGFHILLFFCKRLELGGYNLAQNFSFPFLLAGIVLLGIGIFMQQAPSKSIGAAAFGLLYISMSWGLLLALRYGTNVSVLREGIVTNDPLGYYIPILIIAAIWINDTCAYLVGSMIGKTPFSKISPKKTLEGTLGGMLLCVVAITFILMPWFQWQYLLGISLIAAIAGTAGDLLESKLKRMAGVKDSGRIMPGHGGFLDRFDSLLVAIPFVWLFLIFYEYAY